MVDGLFRYAVQHSVSLYCSHLHFTYVFYIHLRWTFTFLSFSSNIWCTSSEVMPSCRPFQCIKVLYLRLPYSFSTISFDLFLKFFFFPVWVVWINLNKIIVSPVGTRGSLSSIGANHRVYYMRIISVEYSQRWTSASQPTKKGVVITVTEFTPIVVSMLASSFKFMGEYQELHKSELSLSSFYFRLSATLFTDEDLDV